MMGRPGGMGRRDGRPARRGRPAHQGLPGTLRRLVGRLRPERAQLVAVWSLGVISVAFMVPGPKILGDATNVLFNGVVGKQLRPA